jgi:hypothetical protein
MKNLIRPSAYRTTVPVADYLVSAGCSEYPSIHPLLSKVSVRVCLSDIFMTWLLAEHIEPRAEYRTDPAALGFPAYRRPVAASYLCGFWLRRLHVR